MSDLVKRKVRSFCLIFLSIFSVLSGSVTHILADAVDHSRLWVAPMIDNDSKSLYIDVGEDNGKAGAMRVGKWFANPGSLKQGYGESVNEYCGGDTTGKCYYLVYPGVSYGAEDGYTKVDYSLAENAASVMSTSFNVLSEYCGYKTQNVNIKKMLESVAALSEDSNGHVQNGTIQCDGSTSIQIRAASASDNVKPKTAGVNMGTEISNYAVLGGGDHPVTIQYSVPKGYSAGQYGADRFSEIEHNNMSVVSFISMKGMAKYALNAADNNVVAGDSGYAALYGDDSALSKKFDSLVASLGRKISNSLGLSSIEELMLNRGTRSFYYHGIMPSRWMDAARIIYWISLIGSLFVLSYGFLTMLAKRSLANISPTVRADLRTGMLNYGYVMIMQLLYVPLFAAMCILNEKLVELMSSLVAENASFGNITSFGLLSPILAFVTLGLEISINIQYVIRAIMITICFAMGPVFIATITLDDKKRMFGIWLKELVSNIFLQAFNALILAFFIMVSFGNIGYFMKVIIMFSFIPINKWYMEKLWNVSIGSIAAGERTTRQMTQNVRDRAVAAGTSALAANSAMNMVYANAQKEDIRRQAAEKSAEMKARSQGANLNGISSGTVNTYPTDLTSADELRDIDNRPARRDFHITKAGVIGTAMLSEAAGIRSSTLIDGIVARDAAKASYNRNEGSKQVAVRDKNSDFAGYRYESQDDVAREGQHQGRMLYIQAAGIDAENGYESGLEPAYVRYEGDRMEDLSYDREVAYDNAGNKRPGWEKVYVSRINENEISSNDIVRLWQAQTIGQYRSDVRFEKDQDGGMIAVFRDKSVDEIRRPNLKKDIGRLAKPSSRIEQPGFPK